MMELTIKRRERGDDDLLASNDYERLVKIRNRVFQNPRPDGNLFFCTSFSGPFFFKEKSYTRSFEIRKPSKQGKTAREIIIRSLVFRDDWEHLAECVLARESDCHVDFN